MRTKLARLSLPAKILLSTSCTVTLLFAITDAIVWGNINRSMAEICILRPCECAEVLPTPILVLLLAATCGALALTYLLGRHILEPLDRLDRAVADGEDQTVILGPTFHTTCVSIQQAREEPGHQERVSSTRGISESIMHDLRSPVAAIYVAAEMLADADLPAGHTKRLAGNIHRASRRIQELLQDLLNVSRGESRAPEPCCLREIAVAACESLLVTAESYGTTLAVAIQSGIELPLERGRMERAFVNLIGNAIEAMPEGGEVRISAQLVAGSALVHVDDTGPGVPPEIRSKLFQPFVTAGKRNGLGLGLAFTRQTVLDHGGDLWVGNAPGGGARFSLRLPGAQMVKPPALAVQLSSEVPTFDRSAAA
jgi:signal transduction histidine kinase